MPKKKLPLSAIEWCMRGRTYEAMPLRVFLSHDGERHEYFIPDGSLVSDIRAEVKSRFLLGQDDGKSARKLVVLTYLGADLKDEWSFQDIGIMPGATIRIGEREEMRPRLYVQCSFNNDKVKVMDESIEILKTSVSELRTIIAKLVGLPVGVFRLTTADERELFDQHTLDRYDLEIGDTIHLHTWDGWTDFLNLCAMGYTSHVFAQLSDDELVSKFQMKVAMHIACHFGHVDLALNLMKQGVRADDPVGYHPYRQWCNVEPHVDSLKPPIHECGEQGQTALMRALVNYNITAITCKNAYDKTPFQVALMGKQRATAGFLLGKQWSRIQYGPVTNGVSLPLNIYSKLKNWCERAKDRNYHNNGPSKSTLKRRPYITMGGTLVGIGVLVDGYSHSLMNGRSTPTQEKQPERSFMILPSDKQKLLPKQYFKAVTNASKGSKQSRAKIVAGPPHKGRQPSRAEFIAEEDLQSVRQTYQDSSLSRLDESGLETTEHEKKETMNIDSMQAVGDANAQSGGIKSKGSLPQPTESSKLPQLSERKLVKGSLNNKENEGQYIETGKGEEESKENRTKSRGKSKQEEKKERMVISAMKKAKVKTVEYSIPLPLINTENNSRPYLQNCKNKDTDPALTTLALYEKYRGLKSRDSAIKCLSIASNFKDKPWLQQVRLAMDLTSQEVKKRVSSQSSRDSLDLSSNAPASQSSTC